MVMLKGLCAFVVLYELRFHSGIHSCGWRFCRMLKVILIVTRIIKMYEVNASDKLLRVDGCPSHSS